MFILASMLTIVTALGLLVIFFAALQNLNNQKVMTASIRSGIIMLWPLFSHHYISCDVSILPMLWMFFAWICDSFLSFKKSKKEFFELPPSALAGLALGLSGLVGNSPTSRYSYLFVTAILMSFLICVPMNDLEEDSMTSKIVASIQQGALHFCIAMVISGCLLTYDIHRDKCAQAALSV